MSDPLDGRLLCHINLARAYRGGERQAELLIRDLSARGVRQRLIVRKGNLLFERHCGDIPGLRIVAVSGKAFGAALAARGADLVHAHEGQAFYAAALAKLFHRVPYVLTRRVPNPQRPSLPRTLAYSWAGRFTGVSQAVARNVRERHPDLDVVVIPDAHASLDASADVVAALRAEYPGKRLIGHVGALDDAHKGQRTIIAAARRAAVEHPDWQFVLCGDGRDEGSLKAEAAGLGNLSFAGFVNNVGDYLASFSAFVFPSNFEAMGSSLLDAMHFGLPIVASRTGGITEIVEDRVNGLLISPGDSDALLASLDAVLSDPETSERMSRANRVKAKRYDASAMANAYLAEYRALL
ncbi:MAG: glycosyltransferase family 4 protein [Pseudomonadota bacterium]